jgi:flagellar biosynthesis/type III secretory pathway protein FliH
MMASSSDWLTALLDRPMDQEVAKPLDWLPDLGKPNESFVERLPFDRPTDGLDPELASDELPDAETGDALEDILRKALAEREAPLSEPVPEAATTQAEPEADPIAEAFARGEAEGRRAAIADQTALNQHKVNLRQTFRALDQAAMDALAADLAETVVALCSQALTDFIPAPDALKERCLRAAQRLGSGASGATLYLHPDDLRLIEKAGLDGWTIVGDPAAERGGLRFETTDGSISDRPSDWRRAIAAAIRG